MSTSSLAIPSDQQLSRSELYVLVHCPCIGGHSNQPQGLRPRGDPATATCTRLRIWR
jgi:hypothetical protein